MLYDFRIPNTFLLTILQDLLSELYSPYIFYTIVSLLNCQLFRLYYFSRNTFTGYLL